MSRPTKKLKKSEIVSTKMQEEDSSDYSNDEESAYKPESSESESDEPTCSSAASTSNEPRKYIGKSKFDEYFEIQKMLNSRDKVVTYVLCKKRKKETKLMSYGD